MYSHLHYVRCVIGFWPVFKQFLKCVIGVDTCLAILFGFSQKQLELHEINRALVFLKGQLIALRSCTGRALCFPSLEILKGGLDGAQSSPMCLWIWPWFEKGIRPKDLQRRLAN